MNAFRKSLFSIVAITLVSCGTRTAVVSPASAARPKPKPPAAISHGVTPEEEATVLRLEDRREFDEKLVDSWISSPDEHHRARIALALARIGEATFIDANHNGVRDKGERQAGLDQLVTLAIDPQPGVRRVVAFALGQIHDPAGIDTLFSLANDRDPAVASEAVEALTKLASHVSLDRYRELLSPSHPVSVRATGYRYLFRFSGDVGPVAAAAALDDPDSSIRQAAAHTLSRRPIASARARLEALAGNEADPETRAYAVRALGRIGDPASLDTLLSALGDPHQWVRTNAARAISAIAAKDPNALRRDGSDHDAARVIAATNDPDSGTSAVAISTLGDYAKFDAAAKSRLLAIASHSTTPWYRQLAIGAIARVFGEDHPALLNPFLATGRRWEKIELIQSTAEEPREGPEIRKRFTRDDDASVRAAVLAAIPDADVDAEIDLVRDGLADPDTIVRANAIDRFAKASKVDAKAKLDTLFDAESTSRKDSLDDARLSAIQAIARIESDRREIFLRSLLEDRDPVVRRAAADLIENALKQPRPQCTPLPIDRPLSDYVAIAKWASHRHTATLHTSVTDIQLVLLTREAPMTAKNFADLAGKGYFDNTEFMRVVPNFVIQGGDPRNDMSGGPGYAIRDEINLEKYTRATVGMALSGPDTGGSQFFVTHSAQPHLDGGYTIFGRVYDGLTHGLDVIDRGDTIRTIAIDEVPWPTESDILDGEKPALPLVVGPLTRARIEKLVPEYRARIDAYKPDPDVVEALADTIQPGDHVTVVMGTWCTDSLREVPKFMKILDLLHEQYGKDLEASFLAVDRSKVSPVSLVQGLGIQKVPTFIYERDGRETGRIVESPTGLFEDNLLAIAAGAP